MPKDPRVDDYIARQADFARPILDHLRARIHTAAPGAEETIKWSAPMFVHKGKIFARMAAFKHHAVFGFWKRDAIESTGREDEAAGQFGRLESIADLPGDTELDAMIDQAVALIDAGEGAVKRPKKAPKPEAEVPIELAEALAGDALAAKTFTDFPPSCRREYCEWIGEAKRPETRAKRVGETIAWLREGKRRNWKYENC